MARKAKQRISYILPLTNQKGGHRLGINGLAVDTSSSTLYSGGRDGVICAWDLNFDLSQPQDSSVKSPPTTWRQQVQAHTHWINDIALAHSNEALVSASSDVTVKVWRPRAADVLPPQSIGLHMDYVKTLAVPGPHSEWVASGGLDRKICVWDLNGAGQRMCINVGDDEAGSSMLSREKGSVYALAATDQLLASGGPESTVRVWDQKSGKRITKLVGHTDNIRDILISQDGSTIMTASSDRTVKIWSTSAGRCMFTLTMHDSSVWGLFSDHPDLSVFWSSDRTGMIAKTDTRNVIELNEGLSVAVAQEHEGVHKVLAAGGHVWSATSRPSINRWTDVNTDDAEIEVPENYSMHRMSVSTVKTRMPSPPAETSWSPQLALGMNGIAKRKIPLKNALRLSNTSYFPTHVSAFVDTSGSISGIRRGSKELPSAEIMATQPTNTQPEFAVEGQNGLIKHVMLNDRKRVLTLDTAGEVLMWDLMKCVPIKSFGKRHLDEVKDECSSTATVANWCSVDTRTGNVAVTLEENNAFDGEMYADELDIEDDIDFKEDQRINLGKWVLRYLFSNLITEEIRRDHAFRKRLLAGYEEKKLLRENAPQTIQLPERHDFANGWRQDGPPSATTLRPKSGAKASTPGLNIALATPWLPNSGNKTPASLLGPTSNPALSPTAEEGAPLEKRISQQSRQSTDRGSDYFSSSRLPNTELNSPGGASGGRPLATPGEDYATTPDPSDDGTPKSVSAKDGGTWGKKFKKGMSFSGSFSGMKKLGRVGTNDMKKDSSAIVEEKAIESENDDHSSQTSHSRVIEDNLQGVVQKIRYAYEDSLQTQIQAQQAREAGLPVQNQSIEIASSISPSLPAETPVLKPPLNTTILIQEDRPEAGGVADLFEGTVGALGEMCDLVEKAAPTWLGEVLLKNTIPQKDIVKISFVLEPMPGSNLIGIAGIDGNNRLNANRMLRAKKVLGYVAERIEQQPPTAPSEDGSSSASGTEMEMRPEEYLELWCHEQIISPNMTLATIRSHVWRGGGDIIFYYKANGKKKIIPPSSNYPNGVGASGYPPPRIPSSTMAAATTSSPVGGETNATAGFNTSA